MRIVFVGMLEFVVLLLWVVVCYYEVVVVYIQFDCLVGCGCGLMFLLVKLEVIVCGILVFQLESLKIFEVQQQFYDLQLDLMVVVVYGLILFKVVFVIFIYGCWNVYVLLLLCWCGVVLIQCVIQVGDVEIGVCLMQMEVGLDIGLVLLCQYILIVVGELGGQLYDCLVEFGVQVLFDGLGLLCVGIKLIVQLQFEVGVIYVYKLDKVEVRLDWVQDVQQFEWIVWVFNFWLIVEVQLVGECVCIYGVVVLFDNKGKVFGILLVVVCEGIDIVCGQGVLCLCVLQCEGGKVIIVVDYFNVCCDLVVGV